MDYQDPFQGGLNPIFHQDDDTSETARGNGPQKQPKKEKKGPTVKIAALCLSCALLGGIGGGVMAQVFQAGNTTISVGDRTPIELNTVSTDTRKQMTEAEVYANYANSCVGITVDLVSTNSWGIPVSTAAAGSGFVITKDGYIMTNYHVIDGASSIKVTFMDGKSYDAKLIGGDADNDIAVIKIDANDLTPVIIGDSSKMYVGETVLTIGNPLGELTFSLTDGVVSALERPITVSNGKTMTMIQTNCTINSGNSGGPLFNLYGEVIGIVTAKYSGSNSMYTESASVEGLGFAIPISNVKDMISDLMSKGYVSGKPYLGVQIQNVETSVQSYGIPAGAQIVSAAPGLTAAKAGMQEGDIITAVGDKTVTSSAELIEAVSTHKAGETLVFKVFRNGESKDFSVTLGEQTNESVQVLEDYAAKQQEESQKQQQQQQQNGSRNFQVPFF